MSERIPLSVQAATLRTLADTASARSLVRAGLATRVSEAELIIARLKAGADTLAKVERHRDAINRAIAGKQ